MQSGLPRALAIRGRARVDEAVVAGVVDERVACLGRCRGGLSAGASGPGARAACRVGGGAAAGAARRREVLRAPGDGDGDEGEREPEGSKPGKRAFSRSLDAGYHGEPVHHAAEHGGVGRRASQLRGVDHEEALRLAGAGPLHSERGALAEPRPRRIRPPATSRRARAWARDRRARAVKPPCARRGPAADRRGRARGTARRTPRRPPSARRRQRGSPPSAPRARAGSSRSRGAAASASRARRRPSARSCAPSP